MHTTLGIDIGTYAIRLIVCKTDSSRISFDEIISFPIDNEDRETGLENAIHQASEWIAHYAKKTPIDASGMTVDPTLSLSHHRLMPFNDPRILESIIPMQLSEIWTIDDSRLLAFEIGDYIKPVDKKTEEDDESGEDNGGYNIHIINYPLDDLSNLITKLQKYNIDPHVVLPANEAIPYATEKFLDLPNSGWAILDIGANKSLLTIGIDKQIYQTRAFKLGGNSIDQAVADAFKLSLTQARHLKESIGFVAVQGMELQAFYHFKQHDLFSQADTADLSIPEWSDQNGQNWPADPVAMANACAQGISILATAVRQTLVSFAAKNPTINTFQLYLSGGTSNLVGLTDWFSKTLDVPCKQDLPLNQLSIPSKDHFSMEAACAAVAAEINIESSCALNLRRGPLVHKGSLAYLKDNKWILASLVLAVIAAIIVILVTEAKAIDAEHAKLKAALEEASQKTFGKKLMTYQQIEAEITSSEGFSFIPNRTAFTHFSWISNQVNDNLSDIELDLNSLDIDTQRKIVTFRGEVSGDDGLPRFMQLLEQYECFPNEIPEPKTSKAKERTSFTLRVDANQCKMGGESE